MKRILGSIINHPVLMNLFFVVVVLAGIGSYIKMPKEEFPQVSVDRVAVFTVYPGATPKDVEDRVLRPLEDAIRDVEGIKHVYADATEGSALLNVEFLRGTDVDEARDAVQRAVGEVEGLPEDITTPVVRIMRLRVPIIHVALLGDTRRLTLAESLADELVELPGVGEVDIAGADERRLRVTLDQRKATGLGITPGQVAQAIEASTRGFPAGRVAVGEQDVVVRTESGGQDAEALYSMPIASSDGVTIRLGDIATVEEEWANPDVIHRVNGQPAIDLVVLRQDDADALHLVPKIRKWAEARGESLPAGLSLAAYDDSARMVQHRLNVLLSNGLVGLGLVALVLVAFIGRRNALLVMWGMPVAYLGAVCALYLTGNTISVVSTFGLLLVTGIIVDDAVVIVENVQRHLEMGKPRMKAALDGTSEVLGAVFSATLTTCLAFAPLLLLEGTVGRVMRIIPVVVILSLAASLLEAFFVLPGHLAHYAEEQDSEQANGPTVWLRRVYRPIVEWVTEPGRRGKALLMIVGLTLLFMTPGIVMKKSLSAPGRPVFAFVDIDLPPSSSMSQTSEVLADVERWIGEEGKGLVIYAHGTIGRQERQQALPTWGNRYGQFKLGFQNDPEVLDAVPAFLDRLETYLLHRPDVVNTAIETVQGGPPTGRPVDVRVRSRDPERATTMAFALRDHLAQRPGVEDIRLELQPGSASYSIRVNPEKASRWGLQEAQIAQAVRGMFDGATAAEISVSERLTEVRVSSTKPTSLQALSDQLLRLPDGRQVRLRQVADVVRSQGIERIQRVDGIRSIRLHAGIEGKITTAQAERAGLEAAYAAAGGEDSGVTLFYGGELEDSAESFAQLPLIAAMAGLLIYSVLAIQFRSYLQPFIILAAIPLGLAGVVTGLFIFGMDLSLLALIGAVGLIGIVVNDSLVLVDFINQRRREGMPLRQSVIEASLTRLRPILITTVTTVLGLLPLALGVAGKEPLLAPMAVAISVGLSFATALTLIMVPVLYMVLDDLGSRGGPGALEGGDSPQPYSEPLKFSKR